MLAWPFPSGEVGLPTSVGFSVRYRKKIIILIMIVYIVELGSSENRSATSFTAQMV